MKELDRIAAVRDESQAIGAFLDWLKCQGIELCTFTDSGNNGKPRRIPATDADLARIAADGREYSYEWSFAKEHGIDNPEYESWGEGFYPVYKSINAWLAAYFEINEDKAEDERRALLDALRARNS